MLEAIRVKAGGEFREAGEAVGNAFDGTEPGRASADYSEKCGENSGSDFVAPVAEKAGEADAEHGGGEP